LYEHKNYKIASILGFPFTMRTTMDSLLHQQTVSQIQQLKDNYALRRIDDRAYNFARAGILDHYMRVTDHQENLAWTTTRLQRLHSFSPYLGPQEVSVEWQRMCQQFQHPPIIRQCPVPLLPAPLIPPLPGVFGRGSFQQEFVQPPHDFPAAVSRKKPYEAIYPGTGMLLNHAKAFLEDYFLPFRMKSKGGGQNGRLMFCCRRADCTLVCRLVPVPHADPPLFIAEMNRNFNIHTNHSADESEQAQQLVLEPVLGPSGKSTGLNPLSFAVKLYIDRLVADSPNITAERIMEYFVDHKPFYDLPFLTDHPKRHDTMIKVRAYRSNASRARRMVANPVSSVADAPLHERPHPSFSITGDIKTMVGFKKSWT
jgi:hypothetical protein